MKAKILASLLILTIDLALRTGQMTPIYAKFIEFFPQNQIAYADEQTAVYLSNSAIR